MRILIADDGRDVADVVAFGARMTWPTCALTVAQSGSDALRRFGDESPDRVVLDVTMPPPDGFEVCRRPPPAPEAGRRRRAAALHPNAMGDRLSVCRAGLIAAMVTHTSADVVLHVLSPLVLEGV